MLKDRRYKQVIFKAPRKLLEDLDRYAEKECEGNRSLAIRMAIKQLLERERQPMRETETDIQ